MEIVRTPHRCPLCHGSGKLPVAQRKDPKDEICHGCNGRGIVMGEVMRFGHKGYDLAPPRGAPYGPFRRPRGGDFNAPLEWNC